MSSVLYGRLAVLNIGIPGESGKQFKSFHIDPKNQTIADGLRIKFTVEKNSEKTPNKSSIEVYNLAPDTIALLKKPKVSVRLEVGYGAILNANPITELLFSGDGVKSFTRKEGADRVTTIELSDGYNAFADSRMEQTFGEGTKVTGVIDSIIGVMGLGRGEVSGVSESEEYVSGFTASGPAHEVMDDVVAKGGGEWSIQDGQVQVVRKNGATGQEAIFLTSSTGLIGSPSRSGFQNAKNQKDAGVEFLALIQPGLRPGRKVKLESKEIQGVFLLRKVRFTGDTQGGEWQAQCEAVDL